jgi:acetate kinase
MATKIKNYNSIQEIAENLDNELAETKSVLGDYLRKLDEKRTLAENSKKIREIVVKLAGKKNANVENFGEIELNGLKIVLDANAFHELTAIEDVVRSQQKYLLVLQKAREALQPLGQLGDTEGLQFIVLENKGIPQRILLKGF